jgi:hypothetical protein
MAGVEEAVTAAEAEEVEAVEVTIEGTIATAGRIETADQHPSKKVRKSMSP